MSINQEIKNIMLQNDKTKLISLKDMLEKNISSCKDIIIVDSCKAEKTLKIFEIYLPKSFKEKHNGNFVVLRSQSTGNCLYSSISLCLTGNNCMANDLRLQTSIELFLNAEFYSNHPTFHNAFVNNTSSFLCFDNILPLSVSLNSLDSGKKSIDLVQEEAINNCNNENWSSFLCILALSSVCNKKIECLYPDFGLHKFKTLFSSTIVPRITSLNNIESFYLLFCYEGVLYDFSAPFQHNHYTPVIIKENLKRKISNESTKMSQTKIKFYFEAKHQDSSLLLDNIKRKPMEVSTQPPLSLSKFSKITCCESFSLPSNNYDIGYLVSNYTSYSNVAKTLSNSELQHLVKSVFVPCKTYSFPKNLNGRSFQFMWMEKFPWLTYSKIFDGAFCLPCVLFGCNFPSECSLVERLFSKPFDRWNEASRYFQIHAFGKTNDRSVCRNKSLHVKTAEVLFSMSSIWSCKTESIDITSQKIVHSQISKNRQLLQPIIETIILCGRLGLSLRGHRDDSEFHPENGEFSNHTVGNFIELLHFRVKAGDKVLEDHLKYHQRNASYISKTSQNQLVRCCGEVITDTIIAEIKNSKYFSIIADEASDSSNKEQLSLVIRFVDSKFNIREEFISFLHCTNGVTGEGLFDILLKSISDFSLDIMNCRGQSYDGAGAMAGHTKGLSSRILNLNEKASFVHCYSHRLNLAICASCNVQYVKNLLTHVKEVSYFFNLSPTRQQKLEEHIESTVPSAVKKKFKDVCRTRWVEKVNGLDTFQELFIPLVSCLEEMSLNVSKSFNHSTSSSASSLLKLITGFDFIVAMCITRNVFDLTLPITRMLQSKSNDIYDGLNLIQALKDVVSSLRNVVDQHHQMCYEQALKIAQNINVAETKPRTSFISKNRDNTPSESISDYFKFVITIPLLDHLSVELDTRFDDTTLKCYKALVLVPRKMISVVQCSRDTSWKDSIISFSDFYGTDLPNPLALSGELDLWEAFWLNFKGDIPSNISETLKAINFPGFENIKVCLKLLATFPLTSCECERSFSSLRRLKNYMRSTMVQDRLNGLALMNIHTEIVIDIKKVIDKFATINRRLTFK